MQTVWEKVADQEQLSLRSVELARWINEGISFYDLLAQLSADHPVFLGMFLGGGLTHWLRRFYFKK